MTSLFLSFLAGCSVTDEPSLVPFEPVSWTARLDAEVGATPSGITVSPDGDAIVTESVWNCVDGASAGVLRVDQETGESSRIDWVRGFATSAVADASGFSALLATSRPSDPWSFGLSYREYADDGLSYRTYEERAVQPSEMAGEPSGVSVLRGFRTDTWEGFTRALVGGETLWEAVDGETSVPSHVAVAGDTIVATTYVSQETWGLLRYDDRGQIASADPFCGAFLATDDEGAAYGAAIATDGSTSLRLCRAAERDRDAWTVTDDLTDGGWATVAGIAVGANHLVVTGSRYGALEDGVQSYVIWTRAYDLDGGFLWEEEHLSAEGSYAWSVAPAIGPRGEVYVLGNEDRADFQQAPVVLRYR